MHTALLVVVGKASVRARPTYCTFISVAGGRRADLVATGDRDTHTRARGPSNASSTQCKLVVVAVGHIGWGPGPALALLLPRHPPRALFPVFFDCCVLVRSVPLLYFSRRTPAAAHTHTACYIATVRLYTDHRLYLLVC